MGTEKKRVVLDILPSVPASSSPGPERNRNQTSVRPTNEVKAKAESAPTIRPSRDRKRRGRYFSFEREQASDSLNVECLDVTQSKWVQDEDDPSDEIVWLTSDRTTLKAASTESSLRWIHLHRKESIMAFEKFEEVLRELTPALQDFEYAVASKCIKEVKMMRHSFARGKYFGPLLHTASEVALSSVVERVPVQATFLSLPVFALLTKRDCHETGSEANGSTLLSARQALTSFFQSLSLPLPDEEETELPPWDTRLRSSNDHPIRSLLQYSNIVADNDERDLQQVILRGNRRHGAAEQYIHVPELWALTINMYTVITCAPLSIEDLCGENIKLKQAPKKDQRIKVNYTNLHGRLHDFRCRTWSGLLEIISRIEWRVEDIATLLNDRSSEYKLIDLKYRPIDRGRWNQIAFAEATGPKVINMRLVQAIDDTFLTLDFAARKLRACVSATFILVVSTGFLKSLREQELELRKSGAEGVKIEQLRARIKSVAARAQAINRSRIVNRYYLYAARCRILNPLWNLGRPMRENAAMHSSSQSQTHPPSERGPIRQYRDTSPRNAALDTPNLQEAEVASSPVPKLAIQMSEKGNSLVQATIPMIAINDRVFNGSPTTPREGGYVRSTASRNFDRDPPTVPRIIINDKELAPSPRTTIRRASTDSFAHITSKKKGAESPQTSLANGANHFAETSLQSRASSLDELSSRYDYNSSQNAGFFPQAYSMILPPGPSHQGHQQNLSSSAYFTKIGSGLLNEKPSISLGGSHDPDFQASAFRVIRQQQGDPFNPVRRHSIGVLSEDSSPEILQASPQRLPFRSLGDSAILTLPSTGANLDVPSRRRIITTEGLPAVSARLAQMRADKKIGPLPFFEWHGQIKATAQRSEKSEYDLGPSSDRDFSAMTGPPIADQLQDPISDSVMKTLSDIDDQLCDGHFFGKYSKEPSFSLTREQYNKITLKSEADIVSILQAEHDEYEEKQHRACSGNTDLEEVNRQFLDTKLRLFLSVIGVLGYFIRLESRQEAKLVRKIWGIVYSISKLTSETPTNLAYPNQHEVKFIGLACKEIQKLEHKFNELFEEIWPDVSAVDHAAKFDLPAWVPTLFKNIILYLLCALLAVSEPSIGLETATIARDKVNDALDESKSAFLRMTKNVELGFDQIGDESIRTADTLLGLIVENALLISVYSPAGKSGYDCKASFDIEYIYSRYTSSCITRAKREATARLYEDVLLLREEINTINRVLGDQRRLLPGISEARESPLQTLDKRISHRIELHLEEMIDHFKMLSNYAEQAEHWTRNSIEVRGENNNKAIFVFTAITVIFLPLSFIAGLLGMNTSDIRTMNQGQGIFWAISLPFTLVVLLICLCIVQYKFRLRRRFRTLFCFPCMYHRSKPGDGLLRFPSSASYP